MPTVPREHYDRLLAEQNALRTENDVLRMQITRLQLDAEQDARELQKERRWREDLQRLSLDQTVEIEKLKGLQ